MSKKLIFSAVVCVCVTVLNADTHFINGTVGADLLTAINWSAGLPDNTANLGVIGTTHDDPNVFHVYTTARNFCLNRTISMYGSSILTYNINATYRDDTGATLNLYDHSQFVMAPNGGLILGSQDCPLDAGVYNIYDNARWAGFDDITGPITVNVYDNGYFSSRRLGVNRVNLYGGTLDLVSDQGDGNLNINTDGITEWVNLVTSNGWSGGKIIRNDDYVAMFQADIDADRIRVNDAVNTDGDYSKFSIVYDTTENRTTVKAIHPLNPNPVDGAFVDVSLGQLSWTNYEPNLPSGTITCTVYLGTEPNRPQMDSVKLAAGANSVAINETNFPNVYPLIGNPATVYYWIVDSDDSSGGLISGPAFSMTATANEQPVVDIDTADAVVRIWLGNTGDPNYADVTITPDVFSDDGLPSGTLTATWTQTAGPVAISMTTSGSYGEILSLRLPAPRNSGYVFTLSGDDGGVMGPASDTVSVIVGNNSCDASHYANAENPYDAGDTDNDCDTDMDDFANVAQSWLNCSNLLESCL